MSDSTENRKRDTVDPSSVSPDRKTRSQWLNEVPARLWYPIGFVGFFFAIGAWNQLTSTWSKAAGNPIPGTGQPIGLLVGLLLLFGCTAMGIRQWMRERSSREDDRSKDWKGELTRGDDDIRFP